MQHVVVGLLFLTFSIHEVSAQARAVAPSQFPANRFYSPGVDTGDYVYVSGLGAPPGRWLDAGDLCRTMPASAGQYQTNR
jgi:hypothetical protein